MRTLNIARWLRQRRAFITALVLALSLTLCSTSSVAHSGTAKWFIVYTSYNTLTSEYQQAVRPVASFAVCERVGKEMQAMAKKISGDSVRVAYTCVNGYEPAQ